MFKLPARVSNGKNMRTAYLLIVTAAAVVMSEVRDNKEDIIWYPVDDEEGIFISSIGERIAPIPRHRSHRRTRYSGFEPVRNYPTSLSADFTENQDPSFFHNIHNRRPFLDIPSVPKITPPFGAHDYTNTPFSEQGRRRQRQEYQNIDDVINEVFNINQRPAAEDSNMWGGGHNLRPSDSEWFFKPGGPINQNTPNNQNSFSNQNTFSNHNKPKESRPNIPNTTSPNNPNLNRPNSQNRPTQESDKLVFPEESSSSRRTTTPALSQIPTEAPTLSPCERSCPVTPEFNPVCGSDGVTYTNAGKLKCARICGKDVVLSHYGNCGRTRLTTPPLSDTPREKRKKLSF